MDGITTVELEFQHSSGNIEQPDECSSRAASFGLHNESLFDDVLSLVREQVTYFSYLGHAIYCGGGYICSKVTTVLLGALEKAPKTHSAKVCFIHFKSRDQTVK